MVIWFNDPTGRFPRRPYYEDDEFEDECEGIVQAHYRAQGIDPTFPIPTNELLILLEKEASTLDIYARLEPGIDGQTDFLPDGSTIVQVSKDLGEQEFRENRLRTTLTHELAHVKFHERLFRAKLQQLPLFTDHAISAAQCHRSTILGSRGGDWLEWQAGFASTAMLMPRSQVIRIVQDATAELPMRGPIVLSSLLGRRLVGQIQRAFQVSEEAAAIRLSRLNLVAATAQPSLPL